MKNLVLPEGICRQQDKCNSKVEIFFEKDGKYCMKRRKCWLPLFPPFLTMFSDTFFHKANNSWDCVLKSEDSITFNRIWLSYLYIQTKKNAVTD